MPRKEKGAAGMGGGGVPGVSAAKPVIGLCFCFCHKKGKMLQKLKKISFLTRFIPRAKS